LSQPLTNPPPVRLAVPAPIPSISSNTSTNPCHEIIDVQSGTFIDHCMKAAPYKPPTPAEIRESQRKADEAIKVLAPNVKEI